MLGRDTSDIAALTKAVTHSLHLMGRNGPFVYGFSGVEIALWDIAGKRAGKSLCQLLGGTRTEVEAYASLMFYGNDEIATKQAIAAYEKGYRHIKLHERTAAAVAMCKPHLGDTRIMVDVNCAWNLEESRSWPTISRVMMSPGWKSRCGRRRILRVLRPCMDAACRSLAVRTSRDIMVSRP